MEFKQGQSVKVGDQFGYFNFYSGEGAGQVTLEDDRQITCPIDLISALPTRPVKYPVTPAKKKHSNCVDCGTSISYLASRCQQCHGFRVGSINASQNKTRGVDIKLTP